MPAFLLIQIREKSGGRGAAPDFCDIYLIYIRKELPVYARTADNQAAGILRGKLQGLFRTVSRKGTGDIGLPAGDDNVHPLPRTAAAVQL